MPQLARSLAFLAAALVLGLTLPLQGKGSKARSKKQAVLERILGCHEFHGGKNERQALHDAIEKVVREFNILLRPIARRRLEASNPVPEHLCFGRREDDLTVALDDRKYTAPLNGDEVTVTGITGDKLKLHHRVLQTELRQIFVNDEAARINRYHPEKTKLLRMRVRIYSDRLPEDLEYQLTYRRND